MQINVYEKEEREKGTGGVAMNGRTACTSAQSCVRIDFSRPTGLKFTTEHKVCAREEREERKRRKKEKKEKKEKRIRITQYFINMMGYFPIKLIITQQQ